LTLQFKKSVFVVILTQLSILLISFLYYHKLTLLSYINISFYVTSAFLLTSLLVYTIQGGFYDVISKSFNMFFSRESGKRKFQDIPGLSELVTIKSKPLLFNVIFTGGFMILALVVYYFDWLENKYVFHL